MQLVGSILGAVLCVAMGSAAAATKDLQEQPDVRCMAIGLSVPATEARFKADLSIDFSLGIPVSAIEQAYREHKDRIIETVRDEDQESAIELAEVLAKAEARRALESYTAILNKSHFIANDYARCLVAEHYRARIQKYACAVLSVGHACNLASLRHEHEAELPFYKLMASRDPQEMYVAAGAYMRKGEKSKGFDLYKQIIERHKGSPLAIKASDELSSWRRVTENEENMARVERERDLRVREDASRARSSCSFRISKCEDACSPLTGKFKTACWDRCKSLCNQF